MEINVVENGVMQLNHVYNPISLISPNNEQILICMRDGGFEFRYNGVPYRAVNGVLTEVIPDQPKQINEEVKTEGVKVYFRSQISPSRIPIPKGKS